MPKRTSRPKRPPGLDTVQNARRVVLASIGEPDPLDTPVAPAHPALISQVMAEMGRKGGRIGGKRRLETMTSRERSKVAKAAATARWAKHAKKAKKSKTA
ncbi:MAG: hypothetical protein ABL993_15025 [Vicinamibacterales bacterium]